MLCQNRWKTREEYGKCSDHRGDLRLRNAARSHRGRTADWLGVLAVGKVTVRSSWRLLDLQHGQFSFQVHLITFSFWVFMLAFLRYRLHALVGIARFISVFLELAVRKDSHRSEPNERYERGFTCSDVHIYMHAYYLYQVLSCYYR